MIKMINVCAGYAGEEVLHDINLEFEAGKVTVIVGPNGCGKSTLLKTIVKLNEYSNGTIMIGGENMNQYDSVSLARRVAYLPQNKRTPDITVLRMVLHGRFAYLKYPRRYRKEDYEIAMKALRWVGIEDLKDKNVSELSGGTQQKVYIAMALAQDTDTILLDEPTTYLDIAHQMKMMKLARVLADSGKSVVMVLHDLAHGFQVADQMIILREGKVEICGSPEEVYKSGIVENVFEVGFKHIQIDGEKKYFVYQR